MIVIECPGPTTQQINAHYLDPEIVWFDADFGSAGSVDGGPLEASGYYVISHCWRSERRRPDGPFETVEGARIWSRQNLVPHA